MEESAPLDGNDMPFYEAIRAAHGDAVNHAFSVRLARAFRLEKKHRMEKTRSSQENHRTFELGDSTNTHAVDMR